MLQGCEFRSHNCSTVMSQQHKSLSSLTRFLVCMVSSSPFRTVHSVLLLGLKHSYSKILSYWHTVSALLFERVHRCLYHCIAVAHRHWPLSSGSLLIRLLKDIIITINVVLIHWGFTVLQTDKIVSMILNQITICCQRAWLMGYCSMTLTD